MSGVLRFVRRAALPAAVLAAVFLIHFLWLGLFPENGEIRKEWVSLPQSTSVSWLRSYIETGSYWLGLSYALSLAFAAVALRRYRENRMCAARNLAVGGVTLSGALAVGGCYLLGCCGSPMLAVYAGLLGAKFLPWAKPLVAILTTAMIVGAYGWMTHRQRKRQAASKGDCPCA